MQLYLSRVLKVVGKCRRLGEGLEGMLRSLEGQA
jgi:hypothetical protein